jgi:hypothetical protein
LPLVGLGIYDFSLSESSGRDEIADRHFLLLGGPYDLSGFLLGVIREDGFPHRVMQSTTREARAFTHAKDVSKNTAEKDGLTAETTAHHRPFLGFPPPRFGWRSKLLRIARQKSNINKKAEVCLQD